MLDIINKIDDESGYLDFKVEEISGNVRQSRNCHLDWNLFINQEFCYIMSEVSKDQDQETSYKETFRSDSSIGSKIYCRVILLFCISKFLYFRWPQFPLIRNLVVTFNFKNWFPSDWTHLYFLQGVQQRRGGVYICRWDKVIIISSSLYLNIIF